MTAPTVMRMTMVTITITATITGMNTITRRTTMIMVMTATMHPMTMITPATDTTIMCMSAPTGTSGWIPSNARVIVARIVEELSDVDPAHADAYRANGERLAARLTDLELDVADRLAPYRDIPFYTFHEAFRYFAERFDLHSEGAITVSPEVQPGARRVEEIRARISESEHVCVFAEPQFPPRLVDTIVEGTPARTGVVDPLGAEIADGPELYFELIGFNADAFTECFAATM